MGVDVVAWRLRAIECGVGSQDARVFERVLQDGFFDGSEDEADVRGVGCLSKAESVSIVNCTGKS